MKIFPIVTSLMILGIASSAEAAPFQFKSYEAHYTLRYDGIPFGKSKTLFKTDTGKHYYTLCIENKTTLPLLHGATEECSVGLLTPRTVKPLTYDYTYKQGSDLQHIHIDFDWKQKLAIMAVNKSSWHINIPPNTQDKVSYQLLIRRGLSQGQTTFSFPIADGGKLKTYEFNVVEHNRNSIKLTRNPMPSKENVSIWFRPDIDYIVSEAKQNKHIADIGTAQLDSFTWKPHV
jgi:hypothetical protein